jgi:hypothetical protein
LAEGVGLERLSGCGGLLVARDPWCWAGLLNGPEAHGGVGVLGAGPFVSAWCRDLTRSFLMKKFSQRGVLLFGVMLVVCAFVPSMASAASWSAIGTTHQLFSPNLSFTSTGALGQVGSSCNASEFDADVVTANTIEITSARFRDCMGTFGEVNCTVTPTGQNFPWTATATSTTDVQIHGVDVSVVFENTPGNPNACALATTVRVTGTLTGGSWAPGATIAGNELFFQHDDGLTVHTTAPTIASNPVFLNGTFRDTTQTLNMFM